MNNNELYTLNQHRNSYKKELLDSLSFWSEFGFDSVYGGFYTCLERNGTIYSTDKSVWAQGRALWIFAKAYQTIEKKPEWLDMCNKTYDFIENKCFDQDKRMFFSVTNTGIGIQKRRYWYSESFAAIGAMELYKITKKKQHLDFARATYSSIVRYYHDPSLLPPKYNPEVINTKSLASSMIILSTSQIMREGDSSRKDDYDQQIAFAINEILNSHYNPNEKVLLENVSNTLDPVLGPRGRLVNPGHSMEACWFVMNEYIKRDHSDKQLMDQALDVLDHTFTKGWDSLYQGFYYFVDVENKPCEQIEWDMKLWWPHTEALIAYLMAYVLTKNRQYLQRYFMIYDYSFDHFRDREFGEWFGYLHRDGSIANELKGSLYKGPFHLPRCLLMNYLMLDSLLK